MTEIQKDIGPNDNHPFQEDVVPENYFSGGGRGEVLSQMGNGVEEGVALLVLTGDEGSGKTMLCHVFEKEQAADFVTVYFPRTVDSFDDVVKIIARRLEVTPCDDGNGRNRDGTLQEIAGCLVQQSKKLLVIFDEAENIYLATLERIRRMLDRVSALGGSMHILFSGRKAFSENYDQLSICDFERSDELYFSLRPLSEDETLEYLCSSAKQTVEGDGEELITDELAWEIAQLAGGNFRKIKELALQSFSGNGGDDSFMVLLESVEEQTEAQGERAGRQAAIEKLQRAKVVSLEIFSRGKERFNQVVGSSASVSRDLLTRGRKAVPELKERNEKLFRLFDKHRTLLPYVGAGACAVLLLVVFFNLGGDGEHVEQIIHEDNVRDVPVVEAETNPVQVEPVEVVVPVENTVAEEMQPAVVAKTNTIQTDDQQVEGAESDGLTGESVRLEPEEEPDLDIERLDNLEIQPVVIVEAEKPRPQAERKIVELKPSPSTKTRPPTASGAGQGLITVQPRQEIEAKSLAGSRYGARQLLEKRMQAGTAWQRGERGSLYTVQLMVLGSKSAEKNLVQMLAEERYRQEAGNFYILKKKTSPKNFFVFYGEYTSIAMARLAQNSLPKFLRSHKPYAISIKGAVTKVR